MSYKVIYIFGMNVIVEFFRFCCVRCLDGLWWGKNWCKVFFILFWEFDFFGF